MKSANQEIRKELNSGNERQVQRIIKTTSSPVKTVGSRGTGVAMTGSKPTQQTVSSPERPPNNDDQMLPEAKNLVSFADEDYAEPSQELNGRADEDHERASPSANMTAKPGKHDGPTEAAEGSSMRFSAKKRNRLGGSLQQRLNKSFSPGKLVPNQKQQQMNLYNTQTKATSCAWYVPSLQKVVSLKGSRRADRLKPQRQNQLCSFGQGGDFTNSQANEEASETLNLDILTGSRQLASRSPTKGILVQDQAAPQLAGSQHQTYETRGQQHKAIAQLAENTHEEQAEQAAYLRHYQMQAENEDEDDDLLVGQTQLPNGSTKNAVAPQYLTQHNSRGELVSSAILTPSEIPGTPSYARAMEQMNTGSAP